MDSFDKKGFIFFVKCTVIIAAIFYLLKAGSDRAFKWYYSPREIISHVKDLFTDDKETIPLPAISAGAYLIADEKSGKILLEKNKKQVVPIASITKLMTGLIAAESMNLDKKITVSEKAAATYGQSGHLEAGEQLKLSDLLYALLMESSNDAAQAIALQYGETDFVALMNRKARVIGMNNTRFADASGLSAGNRSTAEDLFVLINYIQRNQPTILAISKTKTWTLPATKTNRAHTFTNYNMFSSDPRFIGGKTGYTDEARETLITVLNLPIRTDSSAITFIILGSENRAVDIGKLLKWTEDTYQITSLNKNR